MDEKTFEDAVRKEKRRMIREMKKTKIPAHKMKTIEPIIANVAWMKVKLDNTRESIKTGEIVVEYDNGGGQKGIRENPLFKGYESLFKSYMLGMNRILDAIPDEIPEALAPDSEQSAQQNVLSLVLAKKEQRA